MAPLAGRLIGRYPDGLLGGIGMGVLASGLLLLAALPADPSNADIVWRMALCGAGFGLFQSPNNHTIVTSAPAAPQRRRQRHAGHGAADGADAGRRPAGRHLQRSGRPAMVWARSWRCCWPRALRRWQGCAARCGCAATEACPAPGQSRRVHRFGMKMAARPCPAGAISYLFCISQTVAWALEPLPRAAPAGRTYQRRHRSLDSNTNPG